MYRKAGVAATSAVSRYDSLGRTPQQTIEENQNMPRSTDPPLGPDHTDTDPPSVPPPAGAPRWVKVFAAVALAVAAALVVMGLLTGGHGPGRHLGLGDASPLSNMIEPGPG